MKTAEDIGTNRTGIATSPLEAPEVIAGAEQGGSSPGDESAVAALRTAYARQAEPVGSVPPPVSIKGAVKTVAQALKGEKASVFIDKLGERLAFERTGVRLYALAMVKAETFARWEGAPSVADLAAIQRDELEHFGLLQQCAKDLGADPTAMTPSADVAANLSKGIPAVLADPRTDLRHCLEGLLVAELSDNAGWEGLILLARDLNQDRMVEQFEHALEQEQDHLKRVKDWLRQGVADAATGRSAHKGEQPRAH
jgi:hypothetical protein